MSQQRLFVSGRVQGVGFRAFTRSVALRHGLRGWARNLPDGRVDILLCGPASEIDNARAEIARGPAGSRIDRMETGTADGQPPPPDFELG